MSTEQVQYRHHTYTPNDAGNELSLGSRVIGRVDVFPDYLGKHGGLGSSCVVQSLKYIKYFSIPFLLILPVAIRNMSVHFYQIFKILYHPLKFQVSKW